MSAVRRVGAAFAVSFAVVLSAAGPAIAGSAVEPGTQTGTSVSKVGWWWRANETPDEVANNPVAPAPQPPAPNIPEGTLPVAAATGEPEKVTAIEFALNYGPGATVTSFDLSLRESKEPGANANADAATTKVVACPVTEAFWVDGTAARWGSAPSYDCDLAVAEGKRGANGVWTFDLTPIASLWLATVDATPPSIVLVENVEAPESFQVVFDGVEKKGIGAKLVATGGGTPTLPPTGEGGSGAVDTGSSGAPSDAGAVGDAGSADIGGAAPEAAGLPTPAGGDPAQQDPQAAPVGTPAQMASVLESIPGGAFALIPIVLGLAYAAMLALGPSGEPALATARHGVSRALERMRATKDASKGEQ